ncbi:MAG TPA: hypothetical protein P5572_02385 [Phycisphaerae bacterium]|nr:hypothetical protein [Phycisphaerae bacterium]
MASTKSFTSDSLAISVPDNATSYEAVLSLAGAGSYAVTNAVTINGTALANVEPKLVVSSSAASASFGSISLNGGDTASREAVVDADQNVTVSGNATFTGYAQVDVASGKTLASDALQAGHVSQETRILFSGVGSFVTN